MRKGTSLLGICDGLEFGGLTGVTRCGCRGAGLEKICMRQWGTPRRRDKGRLLTNFLKIFFEASRQSFANLEALWKYGVTEVEMVFDQGNFNEMAALYIEYE